MKKTICIKIIISCGGLLILVIHLIWPAIKIDVVHLGLILIVILPWLSSLIESAEFPGGWKIKFRDIQQAGAKITGIEDTTTTTTTTTTTPPPEAIESKSKPSFLDVMDNDPNLALVGLRIGIEKRIRKLAELEGLKIKQSLSRLLRELQSNGVLNHLVFSGLQEIVMAGNQAAHGAKVEPSIADWAFTYGQDILSALDLKIQNFNN